jgi:hypothetical protein
LDHKRPLPFPPPLQPFAAPADLRPWIEGAVIVRAPAGLGRSCFPGRVSSQLVLRLSGTVRQVPPGDGAEAAAAPLLPAAALIGPSTQPSTFAHEGEVSAVGLILRPEAVAGWLGPIGAQLADHTTALDAVDGPSWNAVLDALQEARDDRERLTLLFDALRRRVQRHPRQEDARCRALQLQRDAGLLPGGTAAPQAPGTRQLQRLFAGTFGMGPKQFQRLLRLRELLHGALRDPSAARGRGAALAQEAGFFDQSHLARDLRGLAGAALTELLRQVQPGNDGTPGEQWPLAMGAAVDSAGNSPTGAGRASAGPLTPVGQVQRQRHRQPDAEAAQHIPPGPAHPPLGQHPGAEGQCRKIDIQRDRGGQRIGRRITEEHLRQHAAPAGEVGQVEEPGGHQGEQGQGAQRAALDA